MTRGTGRMTWPVLAMALACVLALTGCPGDTPTPPIPKTTGVTVVSGKDIVDGAIDLGTLTVVVTRENAKGETVAYRTEPGRFSFAVDGEEKAPVHNKLEVGFGTKAVTMTYKDQYGSANADLSGSSTLSAPILTPEEYDSGSKTWTVVLGHALKGTYGDRVVFDCETTGGDDSPKVDAGRLNLLTVTYTGKTLTVKVKARLLDEDKMNTIVESDSSEGLRLAPQLVAPTVSVGSNGDGKTESAVDSGGKVWNVSFTYAGNESDVSLKYSVLADGKPVEGYDDVNLGTVPSDWKVAFPYSGGFLTDETLTVVAKATKADYFDSDVSQAARLVKDDVQLSADQSVSFTLDNDSPAAGKADGKWMVTVTTAGSTADDGLTVTGNIEDDHPEVGEIQFRRDSIYATRWVAEITGTGIGKGSGDYEMKVTAKKKGYEAGKAVMTLKAPKWLDDTMVSIGKDGAGKPTLEDGALGWDVTLVYSGSETPSIEYAVKRKVGGTDFTPAGGLPALVGSGSTWTVRLPYDQFLTDDTLEVVAYVKANGCMNGAESRADLEKQALAVPTVSTPAMNDDHWEFTVTSGKDVTQKVTTTKTGVEPLTPTGDPTMDDAASTKTCTYQVPYNEQVDAGNEYSVTVTATRIGYKESGAVTVSLVSPGYLGRPTVSVNEKDNPIEGWTVTFTVQEEDKANVASLSYEVLADGEKMEPQEGWTLRYNAGNSSGTLDLPYIMDEKELTVHAKAVATAGTNIKPSQWSDAKALPKIPVTLKNFPTYDVRVTFSDLSGYTAGNWCFDLTTDADSAVNAELDGASVSTGNVTDEGNGRWKVSVPYVRAIEGETGGTHTVTVKASKAGYKTTEATVGLHVPEKLAAGTVTADRVMGSNTEWTVTLNLPTRHMIHDQTVRNTKDTVPAADENGWGLSNNQYITMKSEGQWGNTVWMRTFDDDGNLPSEAVKSEPLLAKLAVKLQTQAATAKDNFYGWKMVIVSSAPGLNEALNVGSKLNFTYRVGTNPAHEGTMVSSVGSLDIPFEEFGAEKNRNVTVSVSLEGYESSEEVVVELPSLTLPALTIGEVKSSEKDGAWYWVVPLSGGVPGTVVEWSLGGDGNSPTISADGTLDLEIPYNGTEDDVSRTVSLKQYKIGCVSPAVQNLVLGLHQISVAGMDGNAKPVKDADGKYSWTVELKSDVAGATYKYTLDGEEKVPVTAGGGEYGVTVPVTVDAGDDAVTAGKTLRLIQVSKDGFLPMTETKKVNLLPMGKLGVPSIVPVKTDEFDWKVKLTNPNDSGTLQYRYTEDADGRGGTDDTAWSEWTNVGSGTELPMFAEDLAADKVKFEVRVVSVPGSDATDSEVVASDVYGRTALPSFTYGYMNGIGTDLEYNNTNKAQNRYPVVTASGAEGSKVRMQLSYEAGEARWWPTNEADRKASAKVAVTERGAATVTVEASESGKMSRKVTSEEMAWQLPEGGYKVGDIGPTGGIVLKAENGEYAEGIPIPGLDRKGLYYCNYQNEETLSELAVLATDFKNDLENSVVSREEWKKKFLMLGHTEACLNDEEESRCHLYRMLHTNGMDEVLNIDAGSIVLKSDLKVLDEQQMLYKLNEAIMAPVRGAGTEEQYTNMKIDGTLELALPNQCNEIFGAYEFETWFFTKQLGTTTGTGEWHSGYYTDMAGTSPKVSMKHSEDSETWQIRLSYRSF